MTQSQDDYPAITAALQLDAKAQAAKGQTREQALQYTRQMIASYGFSITQLFDGKRDTFRNDALKKLRELYAQNPAVSRKEFIAAAVSLGIKSSTAGTQYSQISKSYCAAKKVSRKRIRTP